MLDKLKDISTATLADAVDKLGFRGYMSHRIKPLIEGVRIVGPAVTLWDVASIGNGDLFLTLEAMDNAHPRGCNS